MLRKYRLTIALWLIAAYLIIISHLAMNEVITWVSNRNDNDLLIYIAWGSSLIMISLIIKRIKEKKMRLFLSNLKRTH